MDQNSKPTAYRNLNIKAYEMDFVSHNVTPNPLE